jgi:predicted nucleotidyltransferase
MNRDFEDLLVALSDAGAEYLLIGGYAVSFHTDPRYTKDLDVWVRPTAANARRVMKALRAFGAPLSNLTTKDLWTPDVIFQLGVEPNRIDLLTKVDGVEFAKAWNRRVEGPFGALTVPWISVEDLVANKRAVGRPQDLLDLKKLSPLLKTGARPRRKR